MFFLLFLLGDDQSLLSFAAPDRQVGIDWGVDLGSMWKVFSRVMRFADKFFADPKLGNDVGHAHGTHTKQSHTITYFENQIVFSHICPFNSTCPHWFL